MCSRDGEGVFAEARRRVVCIDVCWLVLGGRELLDMVVDFLDPFVTRVRILRTEQECPRAAEKYEEKFGRIRTFQLLDLRKPQRNGSLWLILVAWRNNKNNVIEHNYMTFTD